MKTQYLKSKKTWFKNENYLLITEKHIISLDHTKIELEDLTPNVHNTIEQQFDFEVAWYKKNWEMVESTKEEFDNFYIKIATNLNDVILKVCEATTIKK